MLILRVAERLVLAGGTVKVTVYLHYFVREASHVGVQERTVWSAKA